MNHVYYMIIKVKKKNVFILYPGWIGSVTTWISHLKMDMNENSKVMFVKSLSTLIEYCL